MFNMSFIFRHLVPGNFNPRPGGPTVRMPAQLGQPGMQQIRPNLPNLPNVSSANCVTGPIAVGMQAQQQQGQQQQQPQRPTQSQLSPGQSGANMSAQVIDYTNVIVSIF